MHVLRLAPLLATLLGASAVAGELPDEARQVWAALDAVKTVKARFEQIQHREILAEPLRSSGELAYARPDRVRWEMQTPARSVFVMRGTRVTTSMPDLGHTETMELSASPEAARVVQGLTVWLGGDLARVERDYDVAWDSGPPHVATLTPREPTLSKLLTKIELTIGGEPVAVQRVVLEEPGGDRVEIAFEAVELGADLPDGTFSAP